MKYEVKCTKCNCIIWVRGSYDPSVNALELDENDAIWTEGCEHIQAGDYEIGEEEVIDFD